MKGFLIPVLAVAALLLLGEGGSGQLASQEEQLVGRLLARLGSAGNIARPVLDYRSSVGVELSVTLLRAASLEGSSGWLDVWLNANWRDARLGWDADEFGGLSQLTLPAEKVWLPDIRSFYTTGYKPDKETAQRVVVYSSGLVIYVLPARVRIICPDRKPKRPVNCSMVLGSWVYSSLQMNLTLGSPAVRLDEWEAGNEWDVADATAERVSTVYPCCPESYLSARYNISLVPKKKPGQPKMRKRPSGSAVTMDSSEA